MSAKPANRSTSRPPAAPAAKAAAEARVQYHFLAQTLRGLEADLRRGLEGSGHIPAEWEEIAQGLPASAKRHVTLRLDEDVWQFFRATGPGHLPRINAVLRSFMHARLAGVVKGPEAVRYEPTEEEEIAALKRQILDSVAAEQAAREAAGPPEDERRARLEELRRLRDMRLGKG